MNRRLVIGLGAASALLAAGGGVTVLAWPSGKAENRAVTISSIPPDPSAKQPAVHAEVDSVELASADLPQRATKTFSMVSVSWTDPSAAPQGDIQVKTRSAKTGTWSSWDTLSVAEGAADRPDEAQRERGATDPYWTGKANGVAVKIGGASALPAGLKVNLIDTDAKTKKPSTGGQGGGEGEPTTSPTATDDTSAPADDPSNPVVSDVPTEPTTEAVPSNTPESAATTEPETAGTTAAPSGTTSESTATPTATPSATTPLPTTSTPVKAQLPAYVTRAGWGADESLVKSPISYASEAKMVFVHHTGFGNGYTCAQAPSVIRGIQANDVTVKGLDDMGYNFLVDQCGTLYEGRKGGVDKAVIGAHTVGFNTASVGIALLGDYTSATPGTAALTTIAQVAAARLGAYGYNPTTTAPDMVEGTTGRVWPQGSTVSLPRISGHKDGERYWTDQAGGKWSYLTECPGTNLYSQLATIRALSVQQITGLAAQSLGGGLSVSGTFYVRTSVSISWTVTTPSNMISRFELLRDGKVAATVANTARSGSIALAAGSHTVQVRAVHVSGATAVTPSYKVIADVTAPTFPASPAPNLRTGTYSTTSAPVTVGYKAADNVKVYTVTATKPSKVNLSPTATAWYTTMKPGTNTTFSLTAKDVPGNARTATVTRKATLLAETKAAKSGSWTTKSSGSYLSGKALSATKKGAKLTYTFTGRSAALIFSRGSKTGQAYVYLDGKKVATVDTKAGTTSYRQGLWVKSLTAKKHTVAIVVVGTSGRPTVVSDGLVYIG